MDQELLEIQYYVGSGSGFFLEGRIRFSIKSWIWFFIGGQIGFFSYRSDPNPTKIHPDQQP